jgi:hypothetical protein
VKVDAITTSAREKIEAAGGKVEMIEKTPMRPKFVAKDGSKREPGTPRRRGGKKARAAKAGGEAPKA